MLIIHYDHGPLKLQKKICIFLGHNKKKIHNLLTVSTGKPNKLTTAITCVHCHHLDNLSHSHPPQIHFEQHQVQVNVAQCLQICHCLPPHVHCFLTFLPDHPYFNDNTTLTKYDFWMHNVMPLFKSWSCLFSRNETLTNQYSNINILRNHFITFNYQYISELF